MYKQRIKIFLALIGLVLLGLIGKLVDLQVIQGKSYRRQFDQNLTTTELLPTIRGKILDRYGKVLAEDRQCYDFCLDYRFIIQEPKWVKQQIQAIRKDEDRTAQQAEEIYNRRVENTWSLARRLCQQHHVDLQEQLDSICRRVQQVRDAVGGPVKMERVGHQIVQVDETAGNDETIGVTFEPSLKRYYPYGDLACHVIGVTGPVSTEEMNLLNLTPQQADRLARIFGNYLEGDLIGKNGVEKMCEAQLRGSRGYMRSRRGGEPDIHAATPGADVTLSLDADMQHHIVEIFSRRGVQGAAVVISVETGEVLALVSVPTYDLNRFRDDYDMLRDNQVDLPLIHRAVAGRYPPGSTAKVVSALAGLIHGLSPQTRYFCAGALNPSDRSKFKCSSTNGHGSQDMIDGIKHSCNVFFYNVGRHVGAADLSESFAMFGYGSPTGIGLPEESGGNLPRRAYNGGDPMQWAIGQGALSATPIQVANAMAAVARGEYVTPTLIKGHVAARRSLPVRKDQFDAVRLGMYKVVNERGGTGYDVFREELTAGERLPVVCGKTGTADCEPLRVDINRDGHVERTEIAKEGNMAWFAGYASKDDPKIAFAIVVEYVPGHGGKEAGPIARDLVSYCQSKGYFDK